MTRPPIVLALPSGRLSAVYDPDMGAAMVTLQPADGSSSSFWVSPGDLARWAAGVGESVKNGA